MMGQATLRRRAGSRAFTTAAGLAATLGVGAVCWPIAVHEMSAMDMGVATQLGSFSVFAAIWVTMMAAMMLPGTVPAVLHHARVHSGAGGVPQFVASYLAVWAAVGVAVYPVDRPHGTVAAGGVAIAAGLYELTPLKRTFRTRCRESAGSGLHFGLQCAGSSIGLMLTMAAVGVMSVGWMCVMAVVAAAQKLLVPKVAVDVPLALAVIALGVLILVAPSAVPGLVPSM